MALAFAISPIPKGVSLELGFKYGLFDTIIADCRHSGARVQSVHSWFALEDNDYQ